MNRTSRPAIAKKTIESRQANRPSESDGLPSIGCRAGMHVRGVMGKRKAKSEARMRESRSARARAPRALETRELCSVHVLPCGILDETPFSNVYPLTLVTLSINPVCLTRASLYQPGLFTQELLQTPKTMAAVDSFIYMYRIHVSCALCGFNQYRGTIGRHYAVLRGETPSHWPWAIEWATEQ